MREFCGPPDSKVAAAIRPATLRARYGTNKVQNAIHCTDLDTDGAIEILYDVIFSKRIIPFHPNPLRVHQQTNAYFIL